MRDFQGLYGIMPTPSKDDVAWDSPASTVDLDEAERLVRALIDDGVNGLVILGTTGECATLTRSEYDEVAECVLATVAGRVPVYVGATALSMHDIVDRLAMVRDLGAAGTLLGLPMWQPLTHDMAVSYYERIAELYPDLPVMVYANSRAFRFPFDADFWHALVDRAPTAIAAKFSRPATLAEFQEASGGRVHFLPHETAAYRFAEISPSTTTACWSTAASMGPEPARAMIEALTQGDASRSAAVLADLEHCSEPIAPIISDPEVFASYNIQIEKLRIAAAGYCRPGLPRPPYDVIPDDYAQAAREAGRRWSEIRSRYAPASSGETSADGAA